MYEIKSGGEGQVLGVHMWERPRLTGLVEAYVSDTHSAVSFPESAESGGPGDRGRLLRPEPSPRKQRPVCLLGAAEAVSLRPPTPSRTAASHAPHSQGK